jgi:iron complex transport system ATP-binding protein
MSVFSTHNLSVGYDYKKRFFVVQENLNLTLQEGEMVCLIGPNGSGKSTLMRTLSGLQGALNGKILIDEHDLTVLSHKKRAEKIAVVLTDKIEIENATVWDIVAFGQHPYNHWIGGLSSFGKEKIKESIRLVNLEHKKDKLLNELSDGEKQRVMIAKALAQDTPIIILDEPTAHLDMPSRVEIMLLLHKLAHETNKTILLSTHELDLALQAADRIWLLHEKRGLIDGVPEDLVLNGIFNQIFQSKSYYFNTANGNFSMNYPLKKTISIAGEPMRMYWTLRALARIGVGAEENAAPKIEITDAHWKMNGTIFNSIKDLLQELEKKDVL